MATSGSVNTSSYDGRYYQFSWTATQSVANNQSLVSWTLKALGGSVSWYAERTLQVLLDDKTELFGKTERKERYTGTVASGTFTVKHDSKGEASFKIALKAAVFETSVNCTGSKTFTLDDIPRKSTLSVEDGTLGTSQTLTVTRYSTDFKHTIVATCGEQSKTICTKSTSTSISFTPPLEWASENTTGTSLSVTYKITTYNGDTSLGSNSYTKTYSIPSGVAPTCSVAVTDPTGYADTYGGFIKGMSKFKVVVTATAAQGSEIASYSTTANGSTYTTDSFTTGVLKTSGTLTVKATVKDKRGRTGSASVSKTVLDYSPPVITKITVQRCNSDGKENDQGEYCKVTFSGSATSLNSKNKITYRLYYRKTDESSTKVDLSQYANSYSVENGTYMFPADTGSSYVVTLQIIDNFNVEKPTAKTTSVSTGFTLLHWLATGLGMGIGKIAELTGFLDIGFDAIFRKNIFFGWDHDNEKNINFRNNAFEIGKTYANDGVYPHNCKIYGGSGSSKAGLGFYDIANSRRVLVYNDHENYIYTESVLRHQICVGYPSSSLTLTSTEWTKVPLDSINPTDLKGSHLELSDGGIKCKKAGFVKFSGQCYITDLTAYDTIGIGIEKSSSSSMSSWFYRKQNHTTMYNAVTDFVVDVKEGDIIYLMARNSTAARGTISSGRSSTRLVVEYVG